MVYFTSDLHLGHANIIRLCRRPFSDVDEMDRFLVDGWNARVRDDDHVYVVGDLSFKSARPVSFYLDRLGGHKHLVVGNHDGSWMGSVDLGRYFESVDMMVCLDDDGHSLVLCHYPMMSWPGHGSFLVYGHVHGNKPEGYWPLLKTYTRALNASVEINGYQPVTFDELVANNESWRRADE